MSWAGGLEVAMPSGPAGLQNIDRGLRNWRLARGLASAVTAGTGFGGIDVVLLGDSIGFGFKSVSPFYDGWFHRLKVLVQSALNPAGVTGGYGFVRIGSGADRRPPFMTSAGTVSDGSSNDGSGGAWVSLPVSSGKANRVTLAFDGTSPIPRQKKQATHVEIVFTKAPNANSDALYDLGTTDPAGGNGNVLASQLIDTSAVAQSNGHRQLLTGLNKNGPNFLQIASGPTSGGLGLYLEGAIAYCDDYDRGVRFHNLAVPSAVTTWIAPQSNKLLTNVGRWCTNLSGATRAKLYIIALGANDMGTGASPNVTSAAYQANLAALADHILSQPTKPSVMFVIFPIRADGGGALFTRTANRPEDYIRAVYSVAATRPDTCVVDLQTGMVGSPYYRTAIDNSYLAATTTHGWHHADLVHLGEGAQDSLARLLAELLL